MTMKHIEAVLENGPYGGKLEYMPKELIAALETVGPEWEYDHPDAKPFGEGGYCPVTWNEDCGMPDDVGDELGRDKLLAYRGNLLYVYLEDEVAVWARFSRKAPETTC